MTSMVETVARAAYEKMTAIVAKTRPGAPFLRWEDLPAEQRHIAMESQRAALQALREPSDAVMKAVWEMPVPSGHPNVMLFLWQAMIDVALNEETT